MNDAYRQHADTQGQSDTHPVDTRFAVIEYD